eukprot:CAMPEP_0181173180 /NCGR_PEP_ID=MMETSP1096-20121128/2857_1 /TAXON_ID=156174 ORGANISM="Chrysochromulina ericina, Strain CCMP281" /NCGR_SAMPLE_ID=MMETSP1096 /ASSEMBLY_ACC=CAM_ASM_000453 /LENGTH=145 /DNA_ID=CAMNT_0023260981 /DNA_START=1905 /DNA_END=2340 /DNA_ORIENTATION=-
MGNAQVVQTSEPLPRDSVRPPLRVIALEQQIPPRPDVQVEHGIHTCIVTQDGDANLRVCRTKTLSRLGGFDEEVLERQITTIREEQQACASLLCLARHCPAGCDPLLHSRKFTSFRIVFGARPILQRVVIYGIHLIYCKPSGVSH